MEKITASLKKNWNGLRKTLIVHKQKCLLFSNSIIGSSHCCSIFFSDFFICNKFVNDTEAIVTIELGLLPTSLLKWRLPNDPKSKQ